LGEEKRTKGGIIIPGSAKLPEGFEYQPEPELSEEERERLQNVQEEKELRARQQIALDFVKSQERFDNYIKGLARLYFNFLDRERDQDKQKAEFLRLNGVYMAWLAEHEEYDHDTNLKEFMVRIIEMLAMDIGMRKQMLENEKKQGGATEADTASVI
jgi:hypothetical protein